MNTQTNTTTRRTTVVTRPDALAAAGETHRSSGAAVIAGFLSYLAVMPVALLGAVVLMGLGF